MAQFRLLSSGKVHVVVRRKGHEPVYGTFPNKTIAKAWAQDLERKMWEKTYLPTRQLDRVPFAILAEAFEGHIVSRTRGHASAHSRLNTLRSSFGEIPIGQITPEQVIDYVDKRLQAITTETLYPPEARAHSKEAGLTGSSDRGCFHASWHCGR